MRTPFIFADFVFVQLVLNIVGHIQIEMTIVVIIRESARSAPTHISNIGLIRYIREGSVSIIPVEAVFSEVGHIQIGMTIVVISPTQHPTP